MAHNFSERNVEGRTILITGASRGIGAHVSEKLAIRKAKLILLAKDGNKLKEFCDHLKHTSGNQHIDHYGCDLSDAAAIREVFNQIKAKHQSIDVLVNNASIMPGIFQDPETLSDELDLLTLRTNIDGYFFVTKYALPLLFASSPNFERTIVFVSSQAGYLTEPEPGNAMLAYHTSKAAENGLMVHMHQLYVVQDQGTQGIRGEKVLHRIVSCHPGFVQTGLGIETAPQHSNIHEYATFKSQIGAISVEDGSDTILWLILANDGVQSGKLYDCRKVHSF